MGEIAAHVLFAVAIRCSLGINHLRYSEYELLVALGYMMLQGIMHEIEALSVVVVVALLLLFQFGLLNIKLVLCSGQLLVVCMPNLCGQ